jgi:hypothetical protein
MELGAVVSNPNRYVKDKLPDGTRQEESALQACWNAISDMGWANFSTEYQNEPLLEEGDNRLDEASVHNKAISVGRGNLTGCEKVTAFIDVHNAQLFWSVVGWNQGAIGRVADYGIEPVNSPRAGSVSRDEYEEQVEVAIGNALRKLITDLGKYPINLGYIDAGYKPEVVYESVRGNKNWRAAIGGSSRAGRYIPPRKADITIRNIGVGFHESFIRHAKTWLVCNDADRWKIRAQEGFRVSNQDAKGSISICGAESHRVFAEHICAEAWDADKKSFKRLSKQNHWLDCVAGCCAAAAMLGITLVEKQVLPVVNRPRSMRQGGFMGKTSGFLGGLPRL